MILKKDINPEYSLYHVGSHILDVLIALDRESSFPRLYENVYGKHKTAEGLFSLALDWLYLIDAIHLDEQGTIKCS